MIKKLRRQNGGVCKCLRMSTGGREGRKKSEIPSTQNVNAPLQRKFHNKCIFHHARLLILGENSCLGGVHILRRRNFRLFSPLPPSCRHAQTFANTPILSTQFFDHLPCSLPQNIMSCSDPSPQFCSKSKNRKNLEKLRNFQNK